MKYKASLLCLSSVIQYFYYKKCQGNVVFYSSSSSVFGQLSYVSCVQELHQILRIPVQDFRFKFLALELGSDLLQLPAQHDLFGQGRDMEEGWNTNGGKKRQAETDSNTGKQCNVTGEEVFKR
ncbi:uncharacterized protein LJ206_013592 [Theristicus caerulescens]